MAEARQIDAIRVRRAAGDMGGVVSFARMYLTDYPQGRYADEALLALGDGLAATRQGPAALSAYQRLGSEYPDSALRDESRVARLPLLLDQGKTEEAETLAQEVGSSTSVLRGQARLWLARRRFDDGKFSQAAALLDNVVPGDELPPAQQTESVRLFGLALWKDNQPAAARRWMQLYLTRDDAPEPKAEVLMLLAGDAESGGRAQDALGYYQQVIDRYPVAAALPEALYRRAEVYSADMRNEPQEELAKVRMRQAIAYYGAYIESNHPQYRAAALLVQARMLAQADRNEESLQDYERLAALGEPYRSDVTILRERVAVLKKLHREDDAAGLLDTAARSSALPSQARLELVMDHAELQYERKNCASVEALLQPIPPFSDRDLRRRALFMRGFCRYQRGQWEGASVDFEGFVNDPQYEPLVVTALLDSYEKSAQYPRLARTAEDLLVAKRLEPTEGLLQQLGRVYAHLGEPQKTIDVYARLESVNPQALQTPAVQLSIAIANEAQSQVDEAIRHYQAVLTLGGNATPFGKEYMEAIERLQPLYLRQELFAELVLLNQKSAAQAKDGEQQKRIKAWQAKGELAWGQSLLRKGQRDDGIGHLNKARGETSPADGDLRVEIVVACTQAYAAEGKSALGTRLVKSELAASKASAQRARLVSALVATSADWGTRLAKDGDLDGAIQYYVQALKQLGKAQPQDRYALAMRLDPLYAAKGNFAARSQLAVNLSEDPAFDAMRGELTVYRSEVLKSWARSEGQHGRYKEALEKYNESLNLLPAKEWKRRYDIAAAIAALATPHKDFAAILAAYAKVLPDISEPPVQSQVKQYLGRLDLEWAAQARAAGDMPTAKARYVHALEILDPEPPADRVAALQGLSQVLVGSGKAEEAVKLLNAEAKNLPPGEARQSVQLLLGTLYRDTLREPKQARAWFGRADTGSAAALSLEAGMAMVELDLRAGDEQAAARHLENLVKRDLGDSPWAVPIHYKLAVVYHGRQQLQDALNEYTLVANTESRGARTRYARVIAESKEQAAAIADYLKLTGGSVGSRIAVPKLKESQ